MSTQTTTTEAASGAEGFSFQQPQRSRMHDVLRRLGHAAIQSQKITDHEAANAAQRQCLGEIEALVSEALAATESAGWSWDEVGTRLRDCSIHSIAGGEPERYLIKIGCPDIQTMQAVRDGMVHLREAPASTGWVLVPREPTDAMIQDGGSMLPPTHRLTDCYDYFREAWAAALDARPIPPSALAGEAGTPSSTPHPQSPSLSEVEEAALSRAHADGIRAANWTLFTHEQSLAIRQKYLPAALATLTASQAQDGEVRS
jgi:hypothetical protein